MTPVEADDGQDGGEDGKGGRQSAENSIHKHITFHDEGHGGEAVDGQVGVELGDGGAQLRQHAVRLAFGASIEVDRADAIVLAVGQEE